MAKATLRERRLLSEAETVLREVQRLYRQLQQIPTREKPDPGRRDSGSLAYHALVAQIRAAAARYVAVVDADQGP